LDAGGRVVAWGNNSYGQSDVPKWAQSGAKAVNKGESCSYVIKAEGNVVAWGNDDEGKCTIPMVAQGDLVKVWNYPSYYTMALKNNGDMVTWRWRPNLSTRVSTVSVSKSTGCIDVDTHFYTDIRLTSNGNISANRIGGLGVPSPANVPAGIQGNIVAVAAGYDHFLVVKGNGSVMAFNTSSNIVECPASTQSDVVAVAVGRGHSVALKSNGTVVAWGNNSMGQCNINGLTNVVAIDAGGFNHTGHSLVLKSSGEVVAWGKYNVGANPGMSVYVPETAKSGVVAISTRESHSLALKADGSVVAWGYNDYGQCNVPAGLKLLNEPPTIDFTSLPAGSKIHKLENTLSFNIRASDSDSEDQNLTTTIYLNGTQVKNFTAKNITTGQNFNISNGQLSAANGKEYQITINNKNTFVSKDLNSFKLKAVTKDPSGEQATKEVTLTNYNTTPTISFISLPAGSQIHKLENTLTFNIKAADTDTAIDKNLTTTIYIKGVQANNYTAKNIATGQISNITNGQLSAVNGTEYQITINNKNTYVSSSIDNFELKAITKDNYGATNNKAVNINNYNTAPSITFSGLTTDQSISKHKPNFTFSITATDSDTIDQDLHVSFCLVTSTDGEEIGDHNRKEINVTEFIANGMNITEGDLLAKNNETYTITIDKSKLLTNDINNFILKAVVSDGCHAQGVREISLLHSNAIPTIQFLDLTEGQIIRKSDNILNFRLIIEDQDREVDTELETEIYIGVFGAYRPVTEFTVNSILNTEGKFMAQNGTEYAITLNKGVLVPMYANEFTIKVIATDTCSEKGEKELTLVHYTDILAQWSLDSVKERIAVDSGGQSVFGKYKSEQCGT
jgi:alpha-tubulin suppressor-like RCC1 family protein